MKFLNSFLAIIGACVMLLIYLPFILIAVLIGFGLKLAQVYKQKC